VDWTGEGTGQVSETPDATLAGKPRLRFGLKHLLYAQAVLAASLALYGLPGLFVAAFVLLVWGRLFWEVKKQEHCRLNSESAEQDAQDVDTASVADSRVLPRAQDFTLLELFVVSTIIGALAALFFPAVSRTRIGRVYRSNLESVAYALRAYSDQYGALPPVQSAEKPGEPAHSWRVSILPQLGFEKLYARYSFDEPWDGPNNAKLLDRMPSVYSALGTRNGEHPMTAFHVVTGPGTAWSEKSPRAWDEIVDSETTTALVVECESRAVPWMAPYDLTEDEAVRLLIRPPSFPGWNWDKGFLVSTCQGRVLATADGTTRFSSLSSPDLVRQFLHLSDTRPDPAGDGAWAKWRIVHYGNIAKLIVFILVALWPTVWLYQETCRMKRESRSLPPAKKMTLDY
jgi:type II secretory pathway pseudopilin PulG